MHRVTVEEASRLLGIEKESVRKRVYRGQLRADKEPDGTLRVYVDDVDGVHGPSTDDVHGHESGGVRDELVAALRDQIEHMRRESERKDAIIMQMAQANAVLAARVPELEAPRNGHETPANGDGGVEPRPATAGAHERSEPRSWWRRWFGFE